MIQELKIISQSGRVCAVGYWAEGDAEAARCLCISAGGENQQVEGGREGGERHSGRLGRERESKRERVRPRERETGANQNNRDELGRSGLAVKCPDVP